MYSGKPLGDLSTLVEGLVVRVVEGAQGDDKCWSRCTCIELSAAFHAAGDRPLRSRGAKEMIVSTCPGLW